MYECMYAGMHAGMNVCLLEKIEFQTPLAFQTQCLRAVLNQNTYTFTYIHTYILNVH